MTLWQENTHEPREAAETRGVLWLILFFALVGMMAYMVGKDEPPAPQPVFLSIKS
jgi:hypothetical protein